MRSLSSTGINYLYLVIPQFKHQLAHHNLSNNDHLKYANDEIANPNPHLSAFLLLQGAWGGGSVAFLAVLPTQKWSVDRLQSATSTFTHPIAIRG
jgi:hypothetical protein